MNIDEIRRHNLAELIRSYGSVVAFATAIDRSESQVSQWVNASINSGTGKPRGMRSDSCRHIEKMVGKPMNWMDVLHDAPSSEVVPAIAALPPEGYVRLEHLPYKPSMGRGRAQLAEHVVQHVDVLESFVRQKIGTVNAERIKILTGVGTSMQPKIKDQDIVFVDVEHRWIDAPGYYVIDVAGLLLLKKAMILSTGVLILRSENTDEFPDEERHDLRKAAETITVCGKVLAWWTLMQG